jgi:hypothetical protein
LASDCYAIRVGFSLYEWKGAADGAMRRFNVISVKRMKPEGITSGMIGGSDTLVIVDVGGGFQAP